MMNQSQAPYNTNIVQQRQPLSQRIGGLLSLLLILVVLYPVVHRRVLLSNEVIQRLEHGKALLDQGQIAEAEQEWLKAQRIAPNNPTVLKWLATLYFSQRRTQEARGLFHHLVKVAPEEEHILCQLAEAEMIRGGADLQEMATQDATQAASLEPDCFRAQRVAGELAERQHDTKQAITYLKQALRLNPADIPLRIKLIGKLMEVSELPYAVVLAQEMVDRYPGLAVGYLLLGDLHLRSAVGSKEQESSLQDFLNALHCDPTNGIAHAQLGHLYRQKKQFREAIRHLEAASLLLHSPSTVLSDLYETYKACGDMAQGEQLRTLLAQRQSTESEAQTLSKRLMAEPENMVLKRRYREVLSQLAQEVPLPSPPFALEAEPKSPLQSKVLR